MINQDLPDTMLTCPYEIHLDEHELQADAYYDLAGDDYADAIMADLGMSSDQALFGMYN